MKEDEFKILVERLRITELPKCPGNLEQDVQAIARLLETTDAFSPEVAIGGKPITQTVEGRERYPVRVRYMRELRDTIEAIEGIRHHGSDGHPLLWGNNAGFADDIRRAGPVLRT